MTESKQLLVLAAFNCSEERQVAIRWAPSVSITCKSIEFNAQDLLNWVPLCCKLDLAWLYRLSKLRAGNPLFNVLLELFLNGVLVQVLKSLDARLAQVRVSLGRVG